MNKVTFKSTKYFTIIPLILLVVACGQFSKQKNKEILFPERVNMTGIGVHLNLIVPEDDIFEVYYFEPGEEGFSPRDFVFKKIKGNEMPQDIYFELPEGVFPERLRLDIGKREDQGQIKLNSIGLFYNEKEYVFSEDEIIKGFKPSKFIMFDTDNMTFTTKVVDGRYDPYFYSMRVTNIVNYLLED